MKIAVVVGTRPEIIKMSPVIHNLTQSGLSFSFVLSGQHYDYEMSMRFVEELGLPQPALSLRLNNFSPASQIGEMMAKLEPAVKNADIRILLVQGDTNSMLAAALTGVKLGIKVGHIEAGLRSYDWRMPEEHNRRMVDQVSDFLFAPTETSRRNLVNENVFGRTFVTGNTIVDAVNQYLPTALRTSDIMDQVPFSAYCVATIHRSENVDSPSVLASLTSMLIDLHTPIVFPLHPRTELNLRRFGLYETLRSSSQISLLPPLGYLDTLVLIKNCRLILTDSGGLQEEATVPQISKQVILLRSSTERPEAVDAGFVKITGTNKDTILKSVREVLRNPLSLPTVSPFGEGNAAQRIVKIIAELKDEHE